MKDVTIQMSINEEAKRHDVGVRFDLLDPEFMKAMAKIMAIGAEKYGERNWQKPGLQGEKGGVNHALKHLQEYMAGEPNDYGELEMHMAQVAINAMFEFFHHRQARMVEQQRKAEHEQMEAAKMQAIANERARVAAFKAKK